VSVVSVIGGGLTLALLEALVSSTSTASNAGGLLTGAAGLVRAFVSPAVPLIPDRRTTAGSASSAATTTAGGAQPVAGTLSQTVPVPAAPTGSVTYTSV
jgi:hypothetical protein